MQNIFIQVRSTVIFVKKNWSNVLKPRSGEIKITPLRGLKTEQ